MAAILAAILDFNIKDGIDVLGKDGNDMLDPQP